MDTEPCCNENSIDWNAHIILKKVFHNKMHRTTECSRAMYSYCIQGCPDRGKRKLRGKSNSDCLKCSDYIFLRIVKTNI